MGLAMGSRLRRVWADPEENMYPGSLIYAAYVHTHTPHTHTHHTHTHTQAEEWGAGWNIRNGNEGEMDWVGQGYQRDWPSTGI